MLLLNHPKAVEQLLIWNKDKSTIPNEANCLIVVKFKHGVQFLTRVIRDKESGCHSLENVKIEDVVLWRYPNIHDKVEVERTFSDLQESIERVINQLNLKGAVFSAAHVQNLFLVALLK